MEDPPRPDPSPRSGGRSALLVVVGVVSTGLAFLGVVLPLFPATPFVLLAGACFAASWPQADRWLSDHRMFGPLRRLGSGQSGMTRTFKAGTILVIVASFAGTLLFVKLQTAWRVALVVACSALVLFVVRQPTLAAGDGEEGEEREEGEEGD